MITAIAFILVFTGIILSHELGHFFAAKLSKVRVEEFGIGYPPRLWGKRYGETLYSINLLPFGGFNKLSGEEDPSAPHSLASKNRRTRVFVLASGALVNAVLPFLLFAIAFMVPHDVATGQIAVGEVAPASPAATAGLEPGDIILVIDGKEIHTFEDISQIVNDNLGKEIALKIQKASGEDTTVHLIPRPDPPKGEGAMGIQSRMLTERKTEPFWRAIPLGIKQTFDTFVAFKNAIFGLFSSDTSGLSLTGPVGIAQLTGEATRAGFSILLQFAAFLSLNLAIINLLPLPALDGGRIVFIIIEGLRGGKRISPRTEGLIHFIGFALLIGLALLITYQDIVRLINGGSVIP
ncbi:MAG: RIP metalloprotease RseP [Dehalococcoidia bacterium]|nr:RIP metalloprotease RseP [Dehalococcoidia bacterium]